MSVDNENEASVQLDDTSVHFADEMRPAASSTMRALLGARCTDARLYTLRIKIGTRTTSARERLHC